jgi:hypothetical protein
VLESNRAPILEPDRERLVVPAGHAADVALEFREH